METLGLRIKTRTKYSSVPNKRVGWNKRVGRKFSENSINVLVLINVLVGNFGKSTDVN